MHRSLQAWASLPPSPEALAGVLELGFPDPSPLQSPACPSPVLPQIEAKSDFPGILPTSTLPGWQVPVETVAACWGARPVSQGSILRPEKAGCSCRTPDLASPFPGFSSWGLLATPPTSRPPASPISPILTPRDWA